LREGEDIVKYIKAQRINPHRLQCQKVEKEEEEEEKKGWGV
jgi:hypothetical protein